HLRRQRPPAPGPRAGRRAAVAPPRRTSPPVRTLGRRWRNVVLGIQWTTFAVNSQVPLETQRSHEETSMVDADPAPGPVLARPIGQIHQPLREAVQDAIRAAIVEGRYPPGERLLEDQLAQELGVSRNPVREALHALSTEGFVVIEPRRGARVATVSRQRAGELFEVREVLEGL